MKRASRSMVRVFRAAKRAPSPLRARCMAARASSCSTSLNSGLDGAGEKRLMGTPGRPQESRASRWSSPRSNRRLLALTEKVAVLKKGNLEMFGPAAEVMQKLNPPAIRLPLKARLQAQNQATNSAPRTPSPQRRPRQQRPAPLHRRALEFNRHDPARIDTSCSRQLRARINATIRADGKTCRALPAAERARPVVRGLSDHHLLLFRRPWLGSRRAGHQGRDRQWRADH